MRRLSLWLLHATAVLAFLVVGLGYACIAVGRTTGTATTVGKWAWAGAIWTYRHIGVFWACQLYFVGWLIWVLVANGRPEPRGTWRDRQRRGHCRACGYNLAGNVSGVCPACGATAKPADAGACRICGYDLTGNVSGVCPECGTTVAAGAKA